MLEKLREAICFMDPKKRMAGLCVQEIETGELEADFILFQIRTLSR